MCMFSFLFSCLALKPCPLLILDSALSIAEEIRHMWKVLIPTGLSTVISVSLGSHGGISKIKKESHCGNKLQVLPPNALIGKRKAAFVWRADVVFSQGCHVNLLILWNKLRL